MLAKTTLYFDYKGLLYIISCSSRHPFKMPNTCYRLKKKLVMLRKEQAFQPETDPCLTNEKL